jgi:hypothetical protein
VEDIRINLYKVTRGTCRRPPGPCPHTLCRYHLADRKNLDNLPEPCSLVLAEQGGMTLEAVAESLGLTRERIRQIEQRALKKTRLAIAIEEAGWKRITRLAS